MIKRHQKSRNIYFMVYWEHLMILSRNTVVFGSKVGRWAPMTHLLQVQSALSHGEQRVRSKVRGLEHLEPGRNRTSAAVRGADPSSAAASRFLPTHRSRDRVKEVLQNFRNFQLHKRLSLRRSDGPKSRNSCFRTGQKVGVKSPEQQGGKCKVNKI